LPQKALTQDLARFFASLSLYECQARFAVTDCCVSAVLDLNEAVDTPHHARRGVVRRGSQGQLQALFPALIDAQPPALRAPLTETGVMRWGCESNPE
jgi:crotonobetainyl-CoA:carnitine CoA-transferase CaiB-like acyl-CoA transferase